MELNRKENKEKDEVEKLIKSPKLQKSCNKIEPKTIAIFGKLGILIPTTRSHLQMMMMMMMMILPRIRSIYSNNGLHIIIEERRIIF